MTPFSGRTRPALPRRADHRHELHPLGVSGWDPAERLKDKELDGVEADVLYTTLGFRIFWLKDAGLQRDCFRVYDDWLAEFVSYAPARMAGLALISLYDPRAGAAELERCVRKGLKGAMI